MLVARLLLGVISTLAGKGRGDKVNQALTAMVESSPRYPRPWQQVAAARPKSKADGWAQFFSQLDAIAGGGVPLEH